MVVDQYEISPFFSINFSIVEKVFRLCCKLFLSNRPSSTGPGLNLSLHRYVKIVYSYDYINCIYCIFAIASIFSYLNYLTFQLKRSKQKQQSFRKQRVGGKKVRTYILFLLKCTHNRMLVSYKSLLKPEPRLNYFPAITVLLL